MSLTRYKHEWNLNEEEIMEKYETPVKKKEKEKPQEWVESSQVKIMTPAIETIMIKNRQEIMMKRDEQD